MRLSHLVKKMVVQFVLKLHNRLGEEEQARRKRLLERVGKVLGGRNPRK
jgi:hypothetical protein